MKWPFFVNAGCLRFWLKLSMYSVVLCVPSVIWAAQDCQEIAVAYEHIWKNSEHQEYLREASLLPEFGEKFVVEFLRELDPMKLYLLEEDVAKVQQIFDSRLYLTSNLIERVCGYIYKAAEVYKHRVEFLDREIDGLLAHPLNKLTKDSQKLTKDIRFRIDRDNVSWASDMQQLQQRWKEKLLLERYIFYDYSYEDFLDKSESFFKDHHRVVRSDDHIRFAFIKVIIETIGVRGRLLFYLTKFPRIRVLDASQSRYLNRQPFILGVFISWKHIFMDLFSINMHKPFRVALQVGEYSHIGANDKWVNFFDDSRKNKEFVYLRHGRNRYTVQRSAVVPSRFFRPSFYSRHVMMFEERQHDRTPHKVANTNRNRSDRDVLSVGYLFVSNMHLSSRTEKSDDNEERSVVMNTKSSLKDILKARVLLPYRPVTMMVLDLRGSRITHFMKAMSLLEIFLPNKPVFRIKNRDNSIVDIQTHTPDIVFSGGLVVLVDHSTSYFSELVAQVLQEHGRAVIVGEGLGKSTAGRTAFVDRDIFVDIDGVGVVSASSRWVYTIKGKSIQGIGMHPDFTLPSLREGSDIVTSARRNYWLVNRLNEDIEPLKGFSTQRVSKDILVLLKNRSHKRMLERRYPKVGFYRKLIDGSYRRAVKYISFYEAFHMQAQDLLEQKPWKCEGDGCTSVSLNFSEFQRNMREANIRNQYLHKRIQSISSEALVDMEHFLDIVHNEDPVLQEAFHIAADYDRMLQSQPLKTFSMQKKRKKFH